MSEAKLRVDFLEVLAARCGVCGVLGPVIVPQDDSFCTPEENEQAREEANKKGWFTFKGFTFCPDCAHEIMGIRSHYLRTGRFDDEESNEESKGETRNGYCVDTES